MWAEMIVSFVSFYHKNAYCIAVKKTSFQIQNCTCFYFVYFLPVSKQIFILENKTAAHAAYKLAGRDNGVSCIPSSSCSINFLVIFYSVMFFFQLVGTAKKEKMPESPMFTNNPAKRPTRRDTALEAFTSVGQSIANALQPTSSATVHDENKQVLICTILTWHVNLFLCELLFADVVLCIYSRSKPVHRTVQKF